MVKNIGLEVIRKGFAGFCPAWRFCPVFRPVIVAQLGFFVFFQLVCVIVSCKALCGLIAGYLTPEVRHGTVSGGMAFFLAVDYGIAGTFGAVWVFKFLPVNLRVGAFLFALLLDIPEKLCEGYIVALYFDRIAFMYIGAMPIKLPTAVVNSFLRDPVTL